MNVVAYTRVSTDGQIGEDKFGLEAQKEQIKEYCEKEGHTILRWYTDEGESGAKYRPGFDEIVYGDITNPPFEAVVVAKSDRVARDINVYFYYQGALLRKNIQLISITEDFGQYGIFANMFKAFTLTCAEMERDNINKRTSAGRKIKADKGGYSGGRPPFGYKAFGHSLIIDEREAECVREIFEMSDDGMPIRKIISVLTEDGYTTRTGAEFAPSSIKAIVDNRMLYLGYYRYGKDSEWVKGVHEPILKTED